MTFDQTPITDPAFMSRAERIVGYFPQGLISLGTMCERSAQLAEEFAGLRIPAYDLRLPSNHPVFRVQRHSPKHQTADPDENTSENRLRLV